MFDIIAIGKKLIASVRSADVAGSLRAAGELLPKLADLYEALRNSLFMAPSPDVQAEFDSVVSELDEALAAPVVMGDGVGGVNFDKVLAILQKIQDLLKILKPAS